MSAPRPALGITDPIPAVLSHYERELQETLERSGVPFQRIDIASIEGLSAPGKIAAIIRTVIGARRVLARREPVLQLWPSLGLLDALVWRSRRSRAAVIFHDPTPIRKQFGFGTLSRWVVGAVPRGAAPKIVSHSSDASVELHDLFARYPHARVAHPVLSAQAPRGATSGSPVVLVAGQYKPERDLQLLAALGPLLRDAGYTPRIVGRGWPVEELPEWELRNEFVPDDDLESEIAAAAVVLVPYRRFYQSGIMLRSIESSVPVVAPDNSFVRAVLGPSSPWILRTDAPDAWAATVVDAVEDPSPVIESFEQYRERCDVSWRAFWEVMK